MFRFGRELFQGLLKMFVRTNKRFPNPEESRFIQNQAIRIKNDLLEKKIDLDAINAEEALRIYSRLRPKRPGPKADVLPFKYKKSFKDELAEMEKKGELPKSQGIGSLMTETEAETIARMNRQNKEAVQRLRDKKKTAEEIIDEGDFDPSGMRDGGRIGYGYGTGLKLLKLLKKENLTLKKAIQEARERFTNYSGDLKYDADAVLDDILDTYGIDRDLVDQYDIIDAYDKIYKDLSKSKYQNMYDIAAQRAMSGQDEIMELKAKYPGITDELAEKIANDPNPQRKAEALSTFEQAEAMRQKGMDTDQIISTLEKGRKTRRDNAVGGLNYLMGF